MSDTIIDAPAPTQAVAEGAQQVGVTQQQAPASLFREGSDAYEFVDGWAGEGSYANNFKSLTALKDGYENLMKKFHSGGRVGITGLPDANDAESIAQWRETFGVPESPDGYELKPEQLPEGSSWNDILEGDFKAAFHEIGVPPAMAKQIAAKYAEIEARHAEMAMQEHQKSLQAEQAKLNQRFGGDYEKRISQMKAFVESKGYDPADESLFNNPKVVNFLADVMDEIGEDRLGATIAQHGLATGNLPPAQRAQKIAKEAAILKSGGQVDNPDPLTKGYLEGDETAVNAVRSLYRR